MVQSRALANGGAQVGRHRQHRSIEVSQVAVPLDALRYVVVTDLICVFTSMG